MIPKATRPDETITPKKFQNPRPDYRHVRLQRMCVDHGCDCVGSVMKSIHKLEAQRHEQGNSQQYVWEHRFAVHGPEIVEQM
jgi:hypothetical protein